MSMNTSDNYSFNRDEVFNIVQDIRNLLDRAEQESGRMNGSFENWRRTCNRIEGQIHQDIIRFAVIGAIKSGKSTFVNSLLHDDYLKRGAGVVTSIVTRIRKGSEGPKAVLHFKSWDDVNHEIENAVALLQDLIPTSETGHFDIRRQKDRSDLGKALESLKNDLVTENGTFNANGVLISNYLSGYEKVKESIDAEDHDIEFSGNRFSDHKSYVGDDALAVYLKDIQLDIDAELLQPGLEIADCQGSDSPNPLHLAMIQDYLVITHFIIYVISSRTGLRQADMRFLNIIKKMGILEHILFVVNCDFNEHDSLSDLDALVAKIRNELSIVKDDPRLFVFSSLFNLFAVRKPHLNRKDRERLEQWEKLDEMVGRSNEESRKFIDELTGHVFQDRFALLLNNHLERLSVVASSIKHRAVLNRDLLSGKLDLVKKAIDRIRQHQEKIQQIKMLIRDTLDGSSQKLITELKKEADLFFGERNPVVGSVMEYIHAYRLDVSRYTPVLETSGFNKTVYLVFQDFKQAVDQFMAESVNPPIIRFLKEKEARIVSFFESVAMPYEKMIVDSFSDYNQMLGEFGIMNGVVLQGAEIQSPDMEMILRMSGLKFPAADATMRYSARIKTDALLRFGFFSIIKNIKRLFKKPIENEKEDAELALIQSMARMKQETGKSILYNFKNYRENIKFQYIMKLVEKVSEFMLEELDERFQFYMTDLTRMAELVDDKETSRKNTLEGLAEMDRRADDILNRIRMAKERIG